MRLISPEYLRLNAQLHAADPDYGRSSRRWAAEVRALVAKHDFKSVLDYGAGKCELAARIRDVELRSYDPAIAGLDAEPAPAGLVVCTDVLEHVEPECLDAVLKHIDRLATRAIFCCVSTGRRGKRKLPDGRYAQQPAEWWRAKLSEAWGLPDSARADEREYTAFYRR